METDRILARFLDTACRSVLEKLAASPFSSLSETDLVVDVTSKLRTLLSDEVPLIRLRATNAGTSATAIGLRDNVYTHRVLTELSATQGGKSIRHSAVTNRRVQRHMEHFDVAILHEDAEPALTRHSSGVADPKLRVDVASVAALLELKMLSGLYVEKIDRNSPALAPRWVRDILKLHRAITASASRPRGYLLFVDRALPYSSVNSYYIARRNNSWVLQLGQNGFRGTNHRVAYRPTSVQPGHFPNPGIVGYPEFPWPLTANNFSWVVPTRDPQRPVRLEFEVIHGGSSTSNKNSTVVLWAYAVPPSEAARIFPTKKNTCGKPVNVVATKWNVTVTEAGDHQPTGAFA